MESGAACISHPERPAARACARCGSFVCSGCLVRGEICLDCKTLLNREGVPWSGPEKDRALARRCLRWGTWMLRGVFGFGGAGALVLGAWTAGIAPQLLRWVAFGLIGVAVLSGLGAAAAALLGYQRSRRGQPGPAVPGVFPAPAAALMVGVGLVPALMGVALLLS